MLGYVTMKAACLPSTVPGRVQTARLQNLNGTLSRSFSEEVQGSGLTVTSNWLTHYVVLPEESLRMHVPPIPETVQMYRPFSGGVAS